MKASNAALLTTSYAVVLTTVKSPEDARQIAEKLLSERLAACVQMLPIDSLYTWKGEVAADSEVLLLVKTRKELYPELEKAIVAVHKYETPEILLLPVAGGLPAYLNWIQEVTRANERDS
jgi:periplasmic divalent cation tolerance protein